jgi:hypothetical protein
MPHKNSANVPKKRIDRNPFVFTVFTICTMDNLFNSSFPETWDDAVEAVMSPDPPLFQLHSPEHNSIAEANSNPESATEIVRTLTVTTLTTRLASPPRANHMAGNTID